MSIRLGDLTLDPPVFLAPLAGITDLPFRELVASFGAGLVVSEMIASQDLLNAKPGVREKAELGFGVEGTAVQIAGCEAHWMAEAARFAEASGVIWELMQPMDANSIFAEHLSEKGEKI